MLQPGLLHREMSNSPRCSSRGSLLAKMSNSPQGLLHRVKSNGFRVCVWAGPIVSSVATQTSENTLQLYHAYFTWASSLVDPAGSASSCDVELSTVGPFSC